MQLRFIFAFVITLAAINVDADTDNLTGVWEAKRTFGPVFAGSLLLREVDGQFNVDLAGIRTTATVKGDTVQFNFGPNRRFAGKFESRDLLRGFWFQPPSPLDGNIYSTPIRLVNDGSTWRGQVRPYPDRATMYLIIDEVDAQLRATLVNPNRNLGVFDQLTTVKRDADSVTINSRFRGRGPERPTLSGHFHADTQILSLRYANRGGYYDFRRIDGIAVPGFHAKFPEAPILQSAPPQLDDGWTTASPADVDIDSDGVAALVRDIVDVVPKSQHDLSIHALLIARNGKLAVEEYFHGYSRELPHDSRSASKGITAVLAAAAMHAGHDLTWDRPVYAEFDVSRLLAKDPGRRQITLRHLVNMNSGLDCDDRDPNSAANEDFLWDHANELNFYQHTLAAGLIRRPGTEARYCSASANLAGGVIALATGNDLRRLLDRLVAEPMNIDRYAIHNSPDGNPFMGGGIRWLPRDFLKFPQMMMDGGSWNGHEILNAENAELMLTPAVKIDGDHDYGYLWYTVDYPFRGGTVRAHFLGGNGGQIAMAIPQLRTAIVFNAGNYSDRVMFRIQEELIPKYILPSLTMVDK